MALSLNSFLKFSLLISLLGLAGCSGSKPQEAIHNIANNILATEFVSALNSVDGTTATALQLNTNQTLRTTQPSQDEWFVIWDAKRNEYKAVNLNYIRNLVYMDFYTGSNVVASAFRTAESGYILIGDNDGDTNGTAYEVVDYNAGTGYYEGRNSGYLYEDSETTTDVSLMAKEQDQMKFFQKASKVSMFFNISMETSLSMVTLGSKVEKMLSRGHSGQLTEQDQLALLSDIKTLTGVSIEEVQEAANDSGAKVLLLEKIAAKIGTSTQNLEQKFLPEVFGIVL
ncbi:MAG: hypothetical protein WC635_00205 [Bacteriovorax sp.]|jgi:hypothetical protein